MFHLICEKRYKEVEMNRSRLFVATELIGVLALSLANMATAAKKPKGVAERVAIHQITGIKGSYNKFIKT